jgi:hypothetical protein
MGQQPVVETKPAAAIVADTFAVAIDMFIVATATLRIRPDRA